MANKIGRAKKFFATAAAGAVALLALAGTAGAAPADEGTAPGDAAEGATGSLTITKFIGTETGTEGNGGATDVPRTPLAGVKFKVEQVTECGGNAIDLTSSDSWTLIESLKPASLNCTTVAVESGTTGSDGVLKFDDLSMGLYLVTELSGPDGVDLKLGAPFLVTIPYPSTSIEDPQNTDITWVWDVQAYPKNQVDGPTGPGKEVKDPGDLSVGAMIPWTIKGSTMAEMRSKTGQYVWDYRVTDPLDSRLQLAEDTVVVKSAEGIDFVKGEDYTLVCTGGDDVTKAGCTMRVVFTGKGLLKMNGTDAIPADVLETAGLKDEPHYDGMSLTDYITIDFQTKLMESVIGGLSNVAWEYVDNHCVVDPGEPGEPGPGGPGTGEPGDPDPGLPVDPTEPVNPPVCPPDPTEPPPGIQTPEPETHWGAVELFKVDADQNEKTLAGAEFKVIAGKCSDFDAQPTEGFVQREGSDWVVKSDETGKIFFDSLYVGFKNDKNDEDEPIPGPKDYCLVETKAPSGYLLPAWDVNGHDVSVASGETSVLANGYANIENKKVEGPTLPLTGAAGSALLVVGGIGVVLIAFGIVARQRREAEEAA